MPRLLQETLFETGKLRKYAAIPVVAAVAYWSQPANLFAGAEPWAIAGLCIVWIGQLTRIWATGYIKKTHEVCQVGPYTLVRHPLYFGSMLMGIGFIVWGRNWPAAALMTVFWFIFYVPKMLREEQHMLDKFGDTYRNYASKVRALIPGLPGMPMKAGEFNIRGPFRYREYTTVAITTLLSAAFLWWHEVQPWVTATLGLR